MVVAEGIRGGVMPCRTEVKPREVGSRSKTVEGKTYSCVPSAKLGVNVGDGEGHVGGMLKTKVTEV
jgi:hypothetical protein